MLIKQRPYSFPDSAAMTVAYLAPSGEVTKVVFGAIIGLFWDEDSTIFVTRSDGSSVCVKPGYIYVEFPNVSNG